MTLDEALAELATLDDPRIRAVNAAHGDDHGVNLSHLRALAKRIKADQDLAVALWETRSTEACLLATLICRPKAFAAADLDEMIATIRAPKLLDWFVTNVVKPGRHAETLREGWMKADGLIGRAGWSLTTQRVVKSPDGLNLSALLDRIEAEMQSAPEVKQWPMNHCLAEIGIRFAQHRERAIAIGHRLQVLVDYPASPGCTPPFAPLWIAEMVRRASV